MTKKVLIALSGASLLILLTSAVAFILLSEHFTGHFPWEEANDPRVIHERIQSIVLGEEREVIIHLPPDYNPQTKYPVMYVLDGGSEDHAITAKFDVLSAAGFTPKTIVVGIPNMTAENRRLNLVPPFMKIDPEDPGSGMGGGDAFLRFMEVELFRFIEKKHSVSQVRLLSGNSRGGLLVMYSLLHNPKMFQGRFCYSTPFWRENDLLTSKVSAFFDSIDTLETFVYMSAGEKETANIRNGLNRMTKTFQDKAPNGLVWFTNFTPGADHQNNANVSSAIGIGKWSNYAQK